MSGAPAAAPVRLAIDLFADVNCPFCVIGYKNLETALTELAGEITADIRWRPFELNLDTAPEGESFTAHMQRKLGRDPDPAEQERIVQLAAEAGYDLRYQGEAPEPERRIWNTLQAHMLLRWTLVEFGEAAQTRLMLALFDANFQQRRDVSDPEVLLDIAQSVGLDRDAAQDAIDDVSLEVRVRAERQEAVERQVNGVPAMLINGEFLIPGAQSPASYVRLLRAVVENPLSKT